MIRGRAGASTHVGQVRMGNEDAYVVLDGLYVVADGMGGHSAGEVASAIAVKTLAEIHTSTQPGLNTPERVAEAISTANTAIFLESLDDSEKAGMGTTLTALVVTDPSAHQVVIANIGDSRTYRWRDGQFQQVTVDHSHVQTLVERGAISAAEARTHYQRNIVLRALGIDSSIDIDLFPIEVRDGDRFILCSDGLVDEADDSEIENEVRLRSEPQQLADSLVNLANAHGGRDNITVVVVDFSVVDDPSAATRNGVETETPPTGVATATESSSSASSTSRRTKNILALAGAVTAVVAMIVALVLAL
ncbi:MAG: Stp1/IreP family PP2C-type Ser/Thr phosphatase [Actinomycetota bacterium]